MEAIVYTNQRPQEGARPDPEMSIQERRYRQNALLPRSAGPTFFHGFMPTMEKEGEVMVDGGGRAIHKD